MYLHLHIPLKASDKRWPCDVGAWQVNDILMTVSKESRELEDRVEDYVSFMKQYKCAPYLLDRVTAAKHSRE